MQVAYADVRAAVSCSSCIQLVQSAFADVRDRSQLMQLAIAYAYAYAVAPAPSLLASEIVQK